MGGVGSPPTDGARASIPYGICAAVQHGNAGRKDATRCIFPAANRTQVIKYCFAAMLYRSPLGNLVIAILRGVLSLGYSLLSFGQCCRSQHQSSNALNDIDMDCLLFR